MPLKLKRVERANPANRAESKWYLIKESGNIIDLDGIAKEIQDRSAMTKGDILAVLSNLIQVLPTHLKNGDSVRLGGLGSFRLSVTSEGAIDAASVSAKNVKNARVIFTPGVELKKELAGISYTVSAN
jgi:predicted histone-like DNA-binding protein